MPGTQMFQCRAEYLLSTSHLNLWDNGLHGKESGLSLPLVRRVRDCLRNQYKCEIQALLPSQLNSHFQETGGFHGGRPDAGD
jgi:hypothetical protein